MSNKLLDIANDGKIIRHARTIAFSIINDDSELKNHINLKNKLLEDYSSILKFVNIG